MTIYGNNWYCYHWTSSINPISPIVETLCEAFLRAWSTRDLYSNVWRLRDSEFDKLNSSFYFSNKQSIVIPRNDQTWVVTYFVEKDLVLSHVLGTICVLSATLIFSCTMCWALCTCYAKSPMNTKPVYVLTWMASIYICYCWS